MWKTLPSRGKDKSGKDIDDETDIQGLQVITKVLAALLQKKLFGAWWKTKGQTGISWLNRQ